MSALVHEVQERGESAMPVKVCPCCSRRHTWESWCRLPLVGHNYIPAGVDPITEPPEVLELRNCGCDSTIAITLRQAEVAA